MSLLDPGTGDRSSSHAIYVSVLEIVSPAVNGKGSLKVKVFANDLEDAIFNQVQQRPDLLSGDCSQVNVLLSNYFKAHLTFKIDGREQVYSFVSCEVNDISLWLTFEFASPKIWREVEITADYLMELFPTQSNVVSITYQTEKRMFRLTNDTTTETVSF